MKYFLFFSVLFLFVPFCALVTSYSNRIKELIFIVFIFSTAFINRYDINLIYRGWYRAPTRGLEVSFIDLLALILLIGFLIKSYRNRELFYWPASLGLMLAYLGYASLTIILFEPKLFGLLELFKMLRGLLAFLTIALYVRSDRDVRIFLIALGSVLLYLGYMAVMQRYFWGYFRVRGTFVHPSVLANYCTLVAPLILSVGLFYSRGFYQGFYILAWSAAFIATILTITRMGIVSIFILSGGVVLFSVIIQLNPKRIALAVGCGVLCLALFLRGYDRMLSRHIAMTELEAAGDAGAGRKIYYEQAWEMAQAHPFGVGLNNYPWYANVWWGIPYASTSDPGDGTQQGLAHSAFAMTLSELGFPGIVLFLALWIRWLTLSGLFFFVRPPNFYTFIMIGCFFSIIGAALSAITEHNFRNQMFFIVFNIVLGFMVAVRQMHLQQSNQERIMP